MKLVTEMLGGPQAETVKEDMMSKKPTLYIAYGSNLNLPQMAFRCPTATVAGTSEPHHGGTQGGQLRPCASLENS